MTEEIVAHRLPDFLRRYGIGRTHFYDEVRAGRLKARKLGGRTIVLEADAQEWLKGLPSLEPKSAA